jgi:hypothetical protein
MARLGGTYNAEAYAEAALDEFFIRWPPGKEPTPEQVLVLIEIFFEGIDVEITFHQSEPGARGGFDVLLNTLPRLRHSDCGGPPGAPVRQLVMVSLNSIVGKHDERGFSTCTDGRATAAALANGLCVFVRETVCRDVLPLGHDRELDQIVAQWRAVHEPRCDLGR